MPPIVIPTVIAAPLTINQEAIPMMMRPGLAVLNVLHLQGKLPPEQDAFMKDKKPEEELYDIRTDPSEVHNLAGNPEYAETLKKFRSRLAKWCRAVGDVGVTPEYRAGGWPGTYPTRPLAEWLHIESMWGNHILHGGPKPEIDRPPQFFPETKHPKAE